MNLIFIGQLNDPELLAGVGLAYVYMNIFTVMLLGINTGVVTLVSQTYGQGNLRLCGNYINRGRVVVGLAYLPAAFMLAMG